MTRRQAAMFGWVRANSWGLAFAVVLLLPAARLWGIETTPAATPSTPTATTMAVSTATPAQELAAASLDRLIQGSQPVGLDDLRVMQDHVRKLTDQLMKYTVGVQVGQAQGSGVIISKDGYVLTAAHVAGRAKRDVAFIMHDGRVLKGKTLGLNRTLDAGLMKINSSEEFPFAEMGQSDALRDNQWCLATGHPGGYQDDRKAVLRLGRVLVNDKTTITTDCTLVGGDSGGPLFDLSGKVIGINSRIAGPLYSNMHVPVGTFKETWDRLVKAEEWGHFPGNDPYIGVKGEPDVTEAKIASVVPDSPADKAKIQPGDVVVKIGDQDVADFPTLVRIISEHQPGDEVKLFVKRGEETVELKLKIGKKSG
jgi:serine protease Do